MSEPVSAAALKLMGAQAFKLAGKLGRPSWRRRLLSRVRHGHDVGRLSLLDRYLLSKLLAKETTWVLLPDSSETSRQELIDRITRVLGLDHGGAPRHHQAQAVADAVQAELLAALESEDARALLGYQVRSVGTVMNSRFDDVRDQLTDVGTGLESLAAVTERSENELNRYDLLRRPECVKDRLLQLTQLSLSGDVDTASITDSLDTLCAWTSQNLNMGNASFLRAADALDLGVSVFLEQHKSASRVRLRRAQLRERLGKWDLALEDLREYLADESSQETEALLPAGRLLITLGNYSEADRLLQRAVTAAKEPSEEIAAAGLRLWIADYQGDHATAVRAGELLIVRARHLGLGGEVVAGIEHRIGRALYEQAIVNGGDGRLFQLSLGRLRTASLSIDPDNPFSAAWIYRVANRMGNPQSEVHWQEAKEKLSFAGGTELAHLNLLQADRAVADGNIGLARTELAQAEEIWKRSSYSKGMSDVALRMAQLYAEGQRDPHTKEMGLVYARLACVLGKQLGLRAAPRASLLFSQFLTETDRGYSEASMSADERLNELTFSRVLAAAQLGL